ncbi:unnamed protein product [Laminaria digitata]
MHGRGLKTIDPRIGRGGDSSLLINLFARWAFQCFRDRQALRCCLVFCILVFPRVFVLRGGGHHAQVQLIVVAATTKSTAPTFLKRTYLGLIREPQVLWSSERVCVRVLELCLLEDVDLEN